MAVITLAFITVIRFKMPFEAAGENNTEVGHGCTCTRIRIHTCIREHKHSPTPTHTHTHTHTHQVNFGYMASLQSLFLLGVHPPS